MATRKQDDHPGAASPPASSGGFSPAADYVEGELDIHQYLVRRPLSTFFFAVEGDGLQELGLRSGDILVVDRSITPRHGHLVVAFTGGERLVRHLHTAGGRAELRGGPGHQAIPADESAGLEIWGVAVGQFRRLPA